MSCSDRTLMTWTAQHGCALKGVRVTHDEWKRQPWLPAVLGLGTCEASSGREVAGPLMSPDRRGPPLPTAESPRNTDPAANFGFVES